MSQLALLIDLARCIGCGSCEAACKLEHHLGPDQFRTRILTLTRLDDGERLEFVKAVCQQCERPACLRACGAGAITKRESDGIVIVDERRCTGCQECVRACPYGVMGFDPRTQHADKCTLSEERRAAGLPPACVAACPADALSWGPVEDLRAAAAAAGRRERRLDHFGLNPATIYLEHLPARAAP
ncbi:MAG: 4Fe-4S dicluster domain-containing protein [Candidatus Rokuibacteriota bacterium]